MKSLAGVDINDEGSLKPFQKAKIDLLIITAGSQTLDNFSTVTKDTIRQQMETNAIGPLFAVKALHEQLQKGCKVNYACCLHLLPGRSTYLQQGRQEYQLVALHACKTLLHELE